MDSDSLAARGRISLPDFSDATSPVPPPNLTPSHQVSPAGVALIKRFERCARARRDGCFEAYPDPGTGGTPWRIGWGATGPGIAAGTVWT